MKIELSRAQFKAILDGTAHAVEKSGWRPMLAYIQLEVTKERITAVALDGYRAGRVRIMKQSAEEIVDLLIKNDDGDCNGEAIKLIVERYGLQEYIKENFSQFEEADDDGD